MKPDKPLRGAIHEDSPHIKFWEEAREKLLKMRYVDRNTKKPKPNLPSLIERQRNLKTMQKVWEKVQKLGFLNLKPGLLNAEIIFSSERIQLSF